MVKTNDSSPPNPANRANVIGMMAALRKGLKTGNTSVTLRRCALYRSEVPSAFLEKIQPFKVVAWPELFAKLFCFLSQAL
jgi:hypothetical protein